MDPKYGKQVHARVNHEAMYERFTHARLAASEIEGNPYDTRAAFDIRAESVKSTVIDKSVRRAA